MTIVLSKYEYCEDNEAELRRVSGEEMDRAKQVNKIIEVVYKLIQDDVPVQLRITNLPPRSTEYTRASDI